MAESIEAKVIPVSIKVATSIVLFLIGATAVFALWAQTITGKVDQNCHDIEEVKINVRAKAVEIEAMRSGMTAEMSGMRTDMAVIGNDLGYIKGSLARIEGAIDRNEKVRVNNRKEDSE